MWLVANVLDNAALKPRAGYCTQLFTQLFNASMPKSISRSKQQTMLHKYCRILYSNCKIRDLEKADLVCLQKQIVYILSYGIFFNYPIKT